MANQGEVEFTLGGQRIRLSLNSPGLQLAAPDSTPYRPLADWSDDELRARVGQVVAGLDALDAELRALREEQKRRRSG